MNKWLAAATVAVLALLAVLWLQIQSPADEVYVVRKADVAVAPQITSGQQRLQELERIGAQMATAHEKAGKIDPASDAFIYRFDEAITPAVTMAAAKCYTGGLDRVHRNDKTKLSYNVVIKDGVVRVTDVKIVESTIANKAMNDCFVRETALVSWKDDQLPDFATDDIVVLRPERGMKKFNAENLAYEGSGPIGKLETTGKVAASREMPIDDPSAVVPPSE